MSETGFVLLAATVAAAMAFLVRARATSSLRAALRTTAVVLLGWILALRSHEPISWSALGWRIWGMLAISLLALGQAWALYVRDARLPEPSPVAAADRVNVYIAAVFAILLILGDAPQRYAFAVLMVSGAVILAAKRG